MREEYVWDLTTRCWRCCKYRYFDVNHKGVFVDDAWMCDWCVEGLTDKPVKRYDFTGLLNWRPRASR